jgi:tRNA(Ile)-lysidine synthase
LSAALQQGVDFRLTVAGTLVVRRRQRLFLVRERRGVLPLSLAPTEAGIWDGRYTIVNQSRSPIIVTAGPAREIDPSLPGSIRAALAGNAPQIFERNGISTPLIDLADVTPRLSVSADFLPLFDRPLTDAVAMLIGAEPSPACPI